MSFAERMDEIDTSSIRRLFELAAQMKNPINLAAGQPDFNVPEIIKESAAQAIHKNQNKYVPAPGTPLLREEIHRYLKNEGIHSQDILVTAGASGALVLALLALADKHTDVYLVDPYFISYIPMVQLTEAKIHYINTYENNFKLSPTLLEIAFSKNKKSSRRKILIFNSPVNPTGVAYSESEIAALAKVTKRHRVQVISDEVYEHFCFDFTHSSWLKADSSAVLVRTFGKSWGMPGWRIGYAAGPTKIVQKMTALHQLLYVCVPAAFQEAAALALKNPMPEILEIFKRRRDNVYQALKNDFELAKPQGTFYAFVKVPKNNKNFVQKCLKEELLIVPGNVFSQKNTHFRLSFAVDDQVLSNGLEMLIRLSRSK